MVAYCENRQESEKADGKSEFVEYLVIYHLKEKFEIARITLDLDDSAKNNLDEAYNLYTLSQDS
jgi:hypothetical protein